jgi:hypothetical protein
MWTFSLIGERIITPSLLAKQTGVICKSSKVDLPDSSKLSRPVRQVVCKNSTSVLPIHPLTNRLLEYDCREGPEPPGPFVVLPLQPGDSVQKTPRIIHAQAPSCLSSFSWA